MRLFDPFAITGKRRRANCAIASSARYVRGTGIPHCSAAASVARLSSTEPTTSAGGQATIAAPRKSCAHPRQAIQCRIAGRHHPVDAFGAHQVPGEPVNAAYPALGFRELSVTRDGPRSGSGTIAQPIRRDYRHAAAAERPGDRQDNSDFGSQNQRRRSSPHKHPSAFILRHNINMPVTSEDSRLSRLTRICLALPEAACRPCGSHAAFLVRKRIFAYFLNDHHGDGIVSVACKVLPGENTALAAAEPARAYLPSYIGPRGWIALRLDLRKVDWDEVAELVLGSYRLIAPGPWSNWPAPLRPHHHFVARQVLVLVLRPARRWCALPARRRWSDRNPGPANPRAWSPAPPPSIRRHRANTRPW